jgi:hypothetical protein
MIFSNDFLIALSLGGSDVAASTALGKIDLLSDFEEVRIVASICCYVFSKKIVERCFSS